MKQQFSVWGPQRELVWPLLRGSGRAVSSPQSCSSPAGAEIKSLTVCRYTLILEVLEVGTGWAPPRQACTAAFLSIASPGFKHQPTVHLRFPPRSSLCETLSLPGLPPHSSTSHCLLPGQTLSRTDSPRGVRIMLQGKT